MASSTCRIPSEPTAQDLCRILESRYKVDTTELDTPSEVYEKAIDLAQERFRRGLAADFQKRPLGITWISPPWLLRSLISRQIARIRKDLDAKGLKSGQHAYDLAFGRAIDEYFWRERDQGGFGLTFDSAELPRLRTLSQIERERRVSCTDFVNLYLMAAELAESPAIPVELRRDKTGKFSHVGIGFLDPVTKALTQVIDPQMGGTSSTASAGNVWIPISRLEFLALRRATQGAQEQEKDPRKGEAEVDIALRLSPKNYLALYNKASFVSAREEYSEAKRLLCRSVASNPFYDDARKALQEVSKVLYVAPTCSAP